MFHDRAVNNNINKIHEYALKIAFRDTLSKFEELLKKADSITIHQRNLQLITTEIFKTKNEIDLKLMNEIFVNESNTY